MANITESIKYKLNREDFKKIGKGFLIGLGGFVLTYLAELLPFIDFGMSKEIVMILSMAGINAARKWLASK